MSTWASVYVSGTRVSGKRFTPGHEAIDVAPNTPNDHAILGQRDGTVEAYGHDDPIEQSVGSASRGIWVRIRHTDGTSVEHCHLAGVPWPVDDRYDPSHVSGNPVGRSIVRGQPTGFFTGLTGDTTGYHDHLIARSVNGIRIDPEPLLFGEEDTVPEGYVLIKRDDLQNLRDVANGWGEAAATDTGPYRLTVAKNRRQCSVELLDVAKAAQEALEQ